jgi:hypothetical protein
MRFSNNNEQTEWPKIHLMRKVQRDGSVILITYLKRLNDIESTSNNNNNNNNNSASQNFQDPHQVLLDHPVVEGLVVSLSSYSHTKGTPRGPNVH